MGSTEPGVPIESNCKIIAWDGDASAGGDVADIASETESEGNIVDELLCLGCGEQCQNNQ